jgi:hypothetical protein
MAGFIRRPVGYRSWLGVGEQVWMLEAAQIRKSALRETAVGQLVQSQ